MPLLDTSYEAVGKEREAEEPATIEAHHSLCKTEPAEGQREGNQAGEQHSPEDALMCNPAIQAAPADKRLREEIPNRRRE
jgi:hypothetical protein